MEKRLCPLNVSKDIYSQLKRLRDDIMEPSIGRNRVTMNEVIARLIDFYMNKK